ncbi:17367_t:CDS:2 [Dentiscutata heterogama]|uniref:17367_t:CDS:1 n=1 Tax=Dentiscutata heterogama TaxID=1316150 RepID=A0ACA9LJZ3_9GLOM|nr:17367_t:CDS:2 [Dentiscutata heterogama]
MKYQKEKVIETNKYNEYKKIINAPFDYPQTLIDMLDLDKIKQLNNDKLLDNKQKINLENSYRKKLNELNTKVVQEEKEKYNKIEKMIKECEDSVLLNSEMFNEIYRLIKRLSVDKAKACIKNSWIINDEIKIVNKKLNYKKFLNIDVEDIEKLNNNLLPVRLKTNDLFKAIEAKRSFFYYVLNNKTNELENDGLSQEEIDMCIKSIKEKNDWVFNS